MMVVVKFDDYRGDETKEDQRNQSSCCWGHKSRSIAKNHDLAIRLPFSGLQLLSLIFN